MRRLCLFAALVLATAVRTAHGFILPARSIARGKRVLSSVSSDGFSSEVDKDSTDEEPRSGVFVQEDVLRKYQRQRLQLEELQEKMTETSTQLEEERGVNDRLREALKRQINALEIAERETKEKVNEAQKLRVRFDEQDETMVMMRSTLKRKQSEFGRDRAGLETLLEKQRQSYRRRFDELEDAAAKADGRAKAAEEQQARERRLNLDLSSMLGELRNRISSLLSDLRLLERRTLEAMEEKQEMQREFAASTKDFEAKALSLEASVKIAKRERDVMSARKDGEIRQLKEDKEEMETTLTSKVKKLEEELDEAVKAEERTQRLKMDATAAADELRGKNKQLDATIADQLTKLETEKGLVERLREEKEAAEAELLLLRSERESLLALAGAARSLCLKRLTTMVRVVKADLERESLLTSQDQWVEAITQISDLPS